MNQYPCTCPVSTLKIWGPNAWVRIQHRKTHGCQTWFTEGKLHGLLGLHTINEIRDLVSSDKQVLTWGDDYGDDVRKVSDENNGSVPDGVTFTTCS